MSRLEYIQDEYMRIDKKHRDKNDNVQKFLHRLKTFEEKRTFLNLVENKKGG